MTQEEKQLLLVDLSARLPYGVKVRYSSYDRFITCTLHSINPVYNIVDLWSKDACFNPVFIDKIKPYLFPLSSMTSKQKAELSMIVANEYDMLKSFLIEIEFYHKYHFDYRNLIDKNLAIDCTNLNIY